MAVSRKAMTEGIRTPTFLGTLNKARFDNPSVKNQRFLPAPFTQGSRWVLPHQCVYQSFSEKSENCVTILPLRNDKVFDRLNAPKRDASGRDWNRITLPGRF